MKGESTDKNLELTEEFQKKWAPESFKLIWESHLMLHVKSNHCNWSCYLTLEKIANFKDRFRDFLEGLFFCNLPPLKISLHEDKKGRYVRTNMWSESFSLWRILERKRSEFQHFTARGEWRTFSWKQAFSVWHFLYLIFLHLCRSVFWNIGKGFFQLLAIHYLEDDSYLRYKEKEI